MASAIEELKNDIHEHHIEQIKALGDLREQWAAGQATLTAQLAQVHLDVARQNGNVARLQAWSSEHPSDCEVRTLIKPLNEHVVELNNKVSNLKLQLSTEVTKATALAESDAKWHSKLAPWLRIIGTVALGAILARGPELLGLLKIAK